MVSSAAAVIASRFQGLYREKIIGRTTLAGVLIRVDGIGVLIRGENGAGKSACALKLVLEGAELVSDDVVDIRKGSGGLPIGRSPERTRYLIEIRGLGIVNLMNLLGSSAVADEALIHMVVDLTKPNRESNGDPLPPFPGMPVMPDVHCLEACDPGEITPAVRERVSRFRMRRLWSVSRKGNAR